MSALQATRRRFLAFLGGAAAAGPTAAKATMQSLDLGAIGVNLPGLYDGPAGSTSDPADAVEWAESALRKFRAMLPAEINRRRREYQVRYLDADTAALRSMSLVRKIERSRDVQFRADRERTATYYQGIVDRLWD